MRTLLTAIFLLTLPRPLPDPPELDRLDQCIHLRFQDRTAFGMRRILPMAQHAVQAFRPENAAEQAAVDALRAEGFEMALFLAGRGTLASTGPFVDPRRARLQGPALITPLTADLPDRDSMLADARSAIGKGASYTIRRGEWSIAFRPLRATNAGCVACHSTGEAVELGDVLGVATYVFRRH